MRKIAFGFFLGVFLVSGLYVFLHPDPTLRAQVGSILDRDTIYLKNGKYMHGWIINETDKELWVEAEKDKGYIVLKRAECKAVRRNTLMRYVRELM